VGDLRAPQAFGIAIVLLGVLSLWVTISEGAGWTAIVGALGRLVHFLMAAWSLYAVTAVRAFSKQEVVGSSLK
jgi:spore maturation protein SpmA